MSDPVILLAGGASLRMGTLKGLIKRGHKTWLEIQLKRIHDSGLRYVILVLGHGADQYQEMSPWRNVTSLYPELTVSVVGNPSPERGIFSSIQTGIKALPAECSGAFILPIDVPMAKAGTIQSLRNSIGGAEALVPEHEKRGGHPVWLARNLADRILKMDPRLEDSRLDFVIQSLEPSERKRVLVDDPFIHLNINTPAELIQLEPLFNEP